MLPKCNRHRPLTVAMIVRLREELGISADILIGPHRRAASEVPFHSDSVSVMHLPDSATVEDAIERLYLLAKVERGIEQSDAGDTIAHEDIKKRFLG